MTEMGNLTERLRQFAAAREWERFHTPKNLALALAGEVGELAAELQWLPEGGLAAGDISDDLRARLADEVADVLLYLVRFADVCGIDPLAAAHDKITRNESRYPTHLSRGSASKYTAFQAHAEPPQSD